MDKKIKFDDRQTVYATAKASHHNEGDEIVTHPVQAAALVAAGKATEEPPTSKKGKKATS